MGVTASLLIDVMWIVLFGYWGLAATTASKASRAESHLSRGVHMAMMGFAFVLVLTDVFSVGILGQRFLPATQIATIIGLLMTACGVGLAIWARYTLGKNWSGTVTIKNEHELIRTGPYALTRHPIYTGFLLALLGSAVTVGEWRGLVGVAIMLAAYLRKIGIEENWLSQEFGERYQQYRHQVKALIPFLV